MKSNAFKFIVVTRPDGQKLHLNVNQIVYIAADPADESGKKTQIVTSEGLFIINKPVSLVIGVVEGTSEGDL